MENLWGIKNPDSLMKQSETLTDKVLKEQFGKLEELTDKKIYGRCQNIKMNNTLWVMQEGEKISQSYSMLTIGEVVVPNLDNYTSSVLAVYSNPDKDYPVCIVSGGDYIDAEEADYFCRNYEEFYEAIKNILSSDQTTKKIQTLYSKAVII